MEIHFAAAKIGKYATSESGDTLEMVERPHGGLSLVLADGQRSGRSAKFISNVVARKAIQLLSEGVRDGAAARAAHDYLYTYRRGKVSSTLNIVSVDMETRTIVISRNNPAPVLVHTAERGLFALDEPSSSVGVHRNVKPAICEIPIAVGTVVVAFTDGLIHAGTISGRGPLDPFALTSELIATGSLNDPQRIADGLLDEAVRRDDRRPRDDISVVVVSVSGRAGDDVRRLNGRLPL